MKRILMPILIAAIWISISEFVRNQFFLNAFWIDHYKSLGLSFPSSPLNGAVWGIWSLLFAISIFILSKKFSLLQTAIIAWLYGFVMMWLVIGNLDVLPFAILPIAIPLSMLEVLLAAYLIKKLS